VNGIHYLHRAEQWAEALHAEHKETRAGACYDDYLEEGLRSRDFAGARERIRVDAPCVFPSHPRFVRTGPNATKDATRDGCRRSGVELLSRSSSRDLNSMAGSIYESCGSISSVAEGSGECYSDAVSGRLDYCLLDALERILVATAVRSPQGYVPAMATVAGILLIESDDEENAFWMLASFVEDVAPWAFTTGGLPFLAECAALDRAVAVEMPALDASLRRAAVRPSLLCAGWLTKFGAGVLPGESVLRLLDAIVLEGSDVLPQAVLAFLRLNGDAILSRGRGCGAALIDAADDIAASSFVLDDVMEDAVHSARAARESPAWSRLRSDARAAVHSRASALGSLRELDATFGHFAEENRSVCRDEFDDLIWASYPVGCEADDLGVEGVDPTADVSADAATRAFDVARREIADEHRLGVLNNGQTGLPGGAKTSAPETPRSARSCCSSLSAFSRMGDSDEAHVVSHQRWRVTCDRDPALKARLRVANLPGDTAEARVRALLRGANTRGRAGGYGSVTSASEDERPLALGGGAPSPAKLAAAVRTAHAAMGTLDAARSGAKMNRHAAAALESAMLFVGGGERWLEKIRFGPRGSMVLASIDAAVRAAHMDQKSFHVSVIASRDVVPSVGSLLSWSTPFFNRTPHTIYHLLVQSPGATPYVLCKRYSDFKQLHADAEDRGLAADVGPSLELPTGFGSFSSDPSVVAHRRVALQRYMDLLACSGSRGAAAHLRVFLQLDSPPRQKRRVRGACYMGCDGFFGA
jgi:hypothetical protein